MGENVILNVLYNLAIIIIQKPTLYRVQSGVDQTIDTLWYTLISDEMLRTQSIFTWMRATVSATWRGEREDKSGFLVASFPGPAQLSVAISMVKWEKAWYLFSRE